MMPESDISDEALLLVCDRPDGGLADLPERLEQLGFVCDYAIDAHEDPPDSPEPALLLVPAELPVPIPLKPEASEERSFPLWLRLRTRYPAPPVVAVARSRSLGQAVACFRAGVSDYLALPLNPDETITRLRALLHPDANPIPLPLRAAPPFPPDCEAEPEPVEVQLEWAPAPASPTPELVTKTGTTPNFSPPEPSEEAEPDILATAAEAPATVAEGDDVLAALRCMEDALSWLAASSCGWVATRESGEVLYANPAALSLLGATDAERAAWLLGPGWAALAAEGPGGRATSAAAVPAGRAWREKAARGLTTRITRPDGSRIWLRMESALWRREGRPAGVVTTLVNITDDRKTVKRERGA